MPKATWNGAVLAQSDTTEVIDGYHYFPPDSINQDYLRESRTQTICPWKGVAQYITIEVEGQVNRDAGWAYLDPKPAAQHVAGYYAFWKGVRVES